MTTEKVDASSLLASGDDGEAVCYLCLDGGDDEADQPVRRDCACRGSDSGFVHLSCLTNYAATKSELADKMDRDMIEFVKPWLNCPSCHQKYQNELAIDIANKFVPFVRRQYPDDTQMQVESLNLKLGALFGKLQPVRKIEAGVTANVLLSMIDRMKNESPLPRRYLSFAAHAYNTHGSIALQERTEESTRRAVTHFENALEVHETIGDDDGVASARTCIAVAKSIYEGGSNEEVLKASEDVYKVRVAEFGDKYVRTILAGKNYAGALQRASRRDEARELLMKLLATSKQVLGPHHKTTKDIENKLE